MGLRVRERPLPGRRRHRGRRARAARAATAATTPSTAAWPGRPACSRAAAAGAPSTSTTRRSGSTSCRSATSARSPTSRARTSRRTRSRRSRRRRASTTRCAAGSSGCSGRAGGRRLVVRPLGRQPRLRDRRRAARARGVRNRAWTTARCSRAVAWLDSVQNEDGGFGEDIRSYADPRLARARSQRAFPNGVGAISLRRCRRGGQPVRPARRRMVMQHTTGKRRLGGSTNSPARAFRLTS